MRKKILLTLVFLFAIISTFILGWWWRGKFSLADNDNNDSLVEKIIPKPYEAYTIENLSKKAYPKGVLTFKSNIPLGINGSTTEPPKYEAQIYNFKFQPNPESIETKSTSVLINTPVSKDQADKYPLVLMIRGYVDPSIYTPGVGTNRASQVFASNGFITVAPDFLGYAESDINSSNIFESRFQTYTTILSLLATLDTTTLSKWDGEHIFIWAHSNGGQIALTTLEITKQNIPTTLWAPVSKPFPYSILYYTDESQDRGKLIRRELANFEDLYDTDKYSLDLYLERINAPIQLHQGSNDDAVPIDWSNQLAKNLKNSEKDITYYTYPADHNLQPSWNTVVERDLEFFRKYLKD